MSDIFVAELRLTWQIFSLERDRARALNELAGLGTFVPFLFFAFVFPCVLLLLLLIHTFSVLSLQLKKLR